MSGGTTKELGTKLNWVTSTPHTHGNVLSKEFQFDRETVSFRGMQLQHLEEGKGHFHPLVGDFLCTPIYFLLGKMGSHFVPPH